MDKAYGTLPPGYVAPAKRAKRRVTALDVKMAELVLTDPKAPAETRSEAFQFLQEVLAPVTPTI